MHNGDWLSVYGTELQKELADLYERTRTGKPRPYNIPYEQS